MEISSQDDQFITGFVEKLFGYPQLKIHSSYLESDLFLHSSFDFRPCGIKNAENLDKVKSYLIRLISSLSDENYINKLTNEKTLYMYENLKSTYLSMIDGDFIKDVFSGCESHLQVELNCEVSEAVDITQYRNYSDVMKSIVSMFNEYNYLDTSIENFRLLCDEISSNFFQNPNHTHDSINIISTYRGRS
ncbi:hypothetical protein RF11_15083 [Thelohanellus kitauei]|uniref:Uncharacterized protein n=1 Tax=Thelohanellus kitauei TaxID=669202 RepID=A0A0C2IC42_THEKT|nr:hypothetical protein RF11_15083 [Thelohanellus kitauei]